MFFSTVERKTGFAPLIASLAVLALAGCGSSGDDPALTGTGSGAGGGGAGGGTTPPTGNPADAVVMGSTDGGTFTPGTLFLGTTSISAGGTTTVIANLVDANGNAYSESASVSFTSTCAASNQATLDSPIETSSGTAISNYTATGCSGADTITATATPGTTSISATATVTVQPAIIGSLQFESATPANIGIKGFGLTESSAVQFRVLDTQGNPAANQDVTFELNSTLGGILIAPETATSDNTGLVTTFVTSGTVATSVRVTASLMSNPGINTQSDSLVISTGIADQDSFSLSANPLNPEGWDLDNSPSDILIIASDRFNNPVPDGTAIFFTVEGGQVDSSCLTVDGQCTVTWRSSNPRPSNGRATLLATAIGEETFVDLNGNNVLDDTDTFDDRAEAFRDDDESGNYDAGTEEFRDFNSNNVRDPADGEYNGTLCNDANVTNVCSSSKNIFVDNSLVIVMSGSTGFIDLRDGPNLATSNQVTSVNAGNTAYLYVFDVNGQIMPAGTSIRIASSNGTLATGGSFVVPSSNAALTDPSYPLIYPILVDPDMQPSSGTLTVEITSPGGTAVSYFAVVTD